MQTTKCTNCGADIDYAAKFCRRCGQAIDPLEWTTRKLEQPSQFEEPSRLEAPTRIANSWPTSPTYLPPDAMPPQAAVTSGMEPTGQKKIVIALATIVAVLVIALATLAILMFFRKPDETPYAITPPPIPSVPPVPRVPPPGAPAPNSAPPAISKDLMYPGAEVTMQVMGEENAKVVQLTTPDSFDQVVDWYTKHMKPKKQVRIPGGNAVLKGEGVAVMIMNGGDGTSILVTVGEN